MHTRMYAHVYAHVQLYTHVYAHVRACIRANLKLIFSTSAGAVVCNLSWTLHVVKKLWQWLLEEAGNPKKPWHPPQVLFS